MTVVTNQNNNFNQRTGQDGSEYGYDLLVALAKTDTIMAVASTSAGMVATMVSKDVLSTKVGGGEKSESSTE